MSFLTYINVPADCPVFSFLSILDRYNVRIKAFELIGPAGGNPCFTVEHDSRNSALAFLAEYHQSNNLIFLNSCIVEN